MRDRTLGGLCLLLVFVLCVPCAGDPLPPGLPPLGVAAACASPPESAGGPSTDDSRAIASHIVPALTGTATRPETIVERMRALNVPGVSVAVIRGGRLGWARGWGLRDSGTCAPVTPLTDFQAASISKTFAAVLAMRAVERGQFTLDGDFNRTLVRWHLPADPRWPPGTVTLRQILGHAAGLTVPGFSGYPPGTPLPGLMEILDGKPPANNPAVRLQAQPGAAFAYSGGGYEIVQAALEDMHHIAFATLAEYEILQPLGMTRSRFAQPPSADILSDAASGHHLGRPFIAKYYVTPELAAAGLWTTPGDLARFLIDVRAAAAGEGGHLVSPQTARLMLTPGLGDWGLGFAFSGAEPNRLFGHTGGNWGFLSQMFIDPKTGDGIVVMTNGEQGMTLAADIIRAVADHYGWPNYRSRKLADVLATVPLFLRGSMNDWSTASPFRPARPGEWETDLVLRPGDYELKVGSADWLTNFGSAGNDLLGADGGANVLVASGQNIGLKIDRAGTYRFRFCAAATGTAILSASRLGD